MKETVRELLVTSAAEGTPADQAQALGEALGFVMAHIITRADMDPTEAMKFKSSFLYDLVNEIDYHTAVLLIEDCRQ